MAEFSMQAAAETAIYAAKRQAGVHVDESMPSELQELATKIEAKFQLDRLPSDD